jgi:hypothetical protein
LVLDGDEWSVGRLDSFNNGESAVYLTGDGVGPRTGLNVLKKWRAISAVGNRTTITQSFSPQPNHYSDYPNPTSSIIWVTIKVYIQRSIHEKSYKIHAVFCAENLKV